MKITLSKSQWQFIGKKAGWIKKAQTTSQNVSKKECPHCHGKGSINEKLKNLGTGNSDWHIVGCPSCNGKGYITQEDHDSYLHSIGVKPCNCQTCNSKSNKTELTKIAIGVGYDLLDTIKMQGENGLSISTMSFEELKEAKKLEENGFINKVIKVDEKGKYSAYVVNQEKFKEMGWNPKFPTRDKWTHKVAQEETLKCLYCNAPLIIDSNNNRDTETMSGVPIEYYFCPKCNSHFSDTRYSDDPPCLAPEDDMS